MKLAARAIYSICAVILTILIVLVPAWAKPVESKVALQVADAWLAANPAPMVSNPDGKAWKAKSVRPFRGYSGDVLAYIVDLKPRGFIVIPADDEIEPILTFGTESDFTGLLGPNEPLSDILADDIPNRLKNKYKLPLEYHDKVAQRWSNLRKAALSLDGSNVIVATVSPVVNPLISDTWNQSGGPPYTYNYYTPNHYVVGCVATAMAMIVHYYRYPASASCTNTIYVDGVAQTASFNDTFNYDLMPTAIYTTSPLSNIQEVAKLSYDCGVSIRMQYTSSASGAYTTDVVNALKTTFQYGSASWKGSYETDWATVLKNELSAGCPTEMEIWAHPTSGTVGHAIVCDGWGTESGADRFHLNMGWGGYANNWYAVPGFSAGGYYWDQMAGYVYNIRRPTDLPLPTPTFSPDGGTYPAPQSVVISCTTQDAVIHYTTNGLDPTESDPVVSGAVSVDTGLTLKAKAFKTGMIPSAVKSATYAFQTGTPVFNPDGGNVNSALNVAITCTTPGAVIHYTTNGVDPTNSDPIVNGSVRVNGNLTLKAKAWKTGWTASGIKSATYNIMPLSSMKKLPNGSNVAMYQAVVTAVPATSRFYIEADDRSCGIMIYKSGHKATVGSRVTVFGTLGTSSSGEKWITATSITDVGSGAIQPIMLSNRDVGGSDWCYNASTGTGQKGVRQYQIIDGNPTSATADAPGLNNIGMLITTSGKVTYSTTGYFYIDDGSGFADNSGQIGIKVLGSVPQPDPLPPGWTPVGHFVTVTGISSCFKAASPSTDLFRQISATQVNLIQ